MPASEISRYVAMGDSFVSGPSISPPQSGTNVCLRSQRNYPHLLAQELAIPKLTDVGCAGATTYHLLHDVPVPGEVVTAQVESLTSKTDLVTVGIGYNNDLFLTNLLGVCGPTAVASTEACQGFIANQVPDLITRERDAVVAALRTIRRKAPNATVILVGYLPILPESDACPARLFPLANQGSFYDVELAVDDNLRAAASTAGTEFVSMRNLARGHGMCDGDEAWVNGATAAPGDGVVVHPRAVGMQAVADAVAHKLKSYER